MWSRRMIASPGTVVLVALAYACLVNPLLAADPRFADRFNGWLAARTWVPQVVDPSKVVVASVCVGKYSVPEWNVIHENHRAYALKHGYQHAVPTTIEAIQKLPTLNGASKTLLARKDRMYLRLALLQGLLEKSGVGWIFYSDCDAVYANMDVSLAHFFHPTKDLVLCGDVGAKRRGAASINSGHLLVRNTAWTRRMISDIHAMRAVMYTRANAWNSMRKGWVENTHRAFMHDQSLIDAWLGGANIIDPSTWSAAASNNSGDFRQPAQVVVETSCGFHRHHQYCTPYVGIATTPRACVRWL